MIGTSWPLFVLRPFEAFSFPILFVSSKLAICFMLNLKAHDGGVVGVELSRVSGGAPQLITIGADKTLAIWDTISFKVGCGCCRLVFLAAFLCFYCKMAG